MNHKNAPGFETVEHPQNAGASLTVKPHANVLVSSIVMPHQNVGASSTNAVGALSIQDIDRRRRKLGVSLQRLFGEARTDRRSWYDALRGRTQIRKSTLDRLDRALSRLAAGERQVTEGSLTLLYRTWVGIFARELGVDIAAAQAIACDFSAEKPQNPDWIAAARVRRLAIYTLACAFGQKNADVARAAGCSRQGVGKAIAEIEALRERDTALDAMLDRCARLVRP